MPSDDTPVTWHPLTSSLKLHRAQKHLGEVREWRERYGESEPYENLTNDAPHRIEPGEVPVFPLMRIGQSPPPEMGAAAGDCVQDLRSALDHAVGFLVAAHSPDDPKLAELLERAEFPIYWDSAEYRDKGAKRIRGVSPCAKAVIEDAQPHLGPNERRDTLRLLHEIARIDRHRHVHVIGQALEGGTITLVPKPRVELDADAPVDLSEMQVALNLRIAICLSEAAPIGVRPLIALLEQIERGVTSLLGELAECLP